MSEECVVGKSNAFIGGGFWWCRPHHAHWIMVDIDPFNPEIPKRCPLGEVAKLREALELASHLINDANWNEDEQPSVDEVNEVIQAALAQDAKKGGGGGKGDVLGDANPVKGASATLVNLSPANPGPASEGQREDAKPVLCTTCGEAIPEDWERKILASHPDVQWHMNCDDELGPVCKCGHLRNIHAFFDDHDECDECKSDDPCIEYRQNKEAGKPPRVAPKLEKCETCGHYPCACGCGKCGDSGCRCSENHGTSKQAPKEERCERCGWPLEDDVKKGCVAGNCSMRPMPPLRAAQEKCATCNGFGFFTVGGPPKLWCEDCSGTGKKSGAKKEGG